MRCLTTIYLVINAACWSPTPSTDHSATAVFDDYRKEFAFELPVPVTIFVERRIVDYQARVADYLVRIDGRELEVVYALNPDEPLPLRVEVFDAQSAELLAVARADDRVLEIGNADRNLVNVERYTDPSAATLHRLADGALDPAAVTALNTALPARVELGTIPAFFLNRDDVKPASDGVVSTTGTARPVLPTWSANVSLLGAYVLGGSCVDGRTGIDYHCRFCEWDGGPAGLVDGGACAP